MMPRTSPALYEVGHYFQETVKEMACEICTRYEKVVKAPEFITERLRLRHFIADDLPALLQCWCPIPIPVEQYRRQLTVMTQWLLNGYGYWAVVRKNDNEFLGAVGFQQQRKVVPAIHLPEAGWSLLPRWQGRGYATEAMGPVMAWANKAMPHGVCCLIEPDNAASHALARRLGFQHRHDCRYQEHTVGYFEYRR